MKIYRLYIADYHDKEWKNTNNLHHHMKNSLFASKNKKILAKYLKDEGWVVDNIQFIRILSKETEEIIRN